MKSACELKRLAKTADYYNSRRGMSYRLVRAGAQLVLAHARGPRLLELGCASGVMTEIFAEHFNEISVVEGSVVYAEAARHILGETGEVYDCLFEEFECADLYDDIVMAGVLEHVEDPVGLLKRAAGWLAAGGRIHVLVPNGKSLHRRLGVEMGMISRFDELHAGDVAMGHRRVYDWPRLESQIMESGLQIGAKEGNFLKPLSNKQMEDWPAEMLEACEALGREFFEICAEIYVLCRAAD